jgi:hypothetical protein
MIFLFVDWMKTTTTSCDDIQVVDDFGKHVVLPQRHYVISSGFPLTIKMAAFRSNDKKIMRDDVGLLSRLLTKRLWIRVQVHGRKNRTLVVIVVVILCHFLEKSSTTVEGLAKS